MSCVLLFNKPYGILSQFRPSAGRTTLKDYLPFPNIYPAGRLDADSEGLLLLTDQGQLQRQLTHPRFKLPKTYWVQVEGIPNDTALAALTSGVDLGDFVTQCAHARRIDEPNDLWPRTPPIRFRKNIPTAWIELVLTEGKNRQVRRMTARVGYPTLRLVRWRIGPWSIDRLAPGHYRWAAAEVLFR